jgi:LacI family repressor for deo operon, udp, cdd, tsx, nupC, and nupG
MAANPPAPASRNEPAGCLASFLRRQHARTLVLVAQDLAHWHAGEIAASANLAAAASGYRLVGLDFHRSIERERDLLYALQSVDVAGFVFLWDHAPTNLDLYTHLVQQSPCVQVIDPKPIEGLDFVGIDEYSGGLLAMRHLINLGYRRIGHVTLAAPMQCLRERHRAYADAMHQADLPLRAEWTLELPYGLNEGDRARRLPLMRAFLSQPNRPHALFICADWVASEFIECAQELGLGVPEDFAVVGYDDALPYCLTSVPLTTVRIDLQQIGRLAVERLLLRTRDGVHTPPATILIPPMLVVRESSARTTATTERWATVMRHMQENFRRDLSAREVASLVGLDPHYFSHQFCRVFGRRFTDYLNDLRLRCAAHLLECTDHTVQYIAHDAGFGSENHFYALFKRTYGQSPHTFRKQRLAPSNR